MTLQTKKLTYKEYLDAPEIKARYNIVDGEMIMAPSPSPTHQSVLLNLAVPMYHFVMDGGIGRIWIAPLDVVVQEHPLRVRQPDLLFVSNENTAVIGQVIRGAPDLVVEILSPSNSRGAIESKLADYAGLGVLECWLVSPQGQTVEILVLEQGKWRRLAILGMGDNVESAVLAGLALTVDEIFGQT